MNIIPHRFLSKSIRFTLPCAGLVLFASACSKSKVSEPRAQDPQRVILQDFVRQSPSPQQSQQTPDQSATLPNDQIADQSNNQHIPSQTPPQTGVIVGDGITLTQPSAQTPIPTPQATRPNPTGSQSSTQLTLLEAKVGDVNGKPIFTTSFFKPIEARLIADADRMPINPWRRQAAGIINEHLNGIIGDELLRAEALTALTPNQRVGLQAFLNNFRNNLLSENLGSSQLARQRLEREEGTTLDEALRQKEIDTLVQLTLIQEVNKRVNVSWRDIQQRYERDIEEYAPPPTAMFRVIRAFKDTDAVEKIQAELDADTAFIKVCAGPLNTFNADTDGLHTVLIEDTYGSTPFFGSDVLNIPVQNLSIHETVGPIELGSSVYWIMLTDIAQESISLYDAQLKIQRELNFERRKLARDDYLNRLMERARVSSRDEVLFRLVQIAEERYGPIPN